MAIKYSTVQDQSWKFKLLPLPSSSHPHSRFFLNHDTFTHRQRESHQPFHFFLFRLTFSLLLTHSSNLPQALLQYHTLTSTNAGFASNRVIDHLLFSRCIVHPLHVRWSTSVLNLAQSTCAWSSHQDQTIHNASSEIRFTKKPCLIEFWSICVFFATGQLPIWGLNLGFPVLGSYLWDRLRYPTSTQPTSSRRHSSVFARGSQARGMGRSG